eukprot:2924928-Pleurochrysis_carterae.AAC.1
MDIAAMPRLKSSQACSIRHKVAYLNYMHVFQSQNSPVKAGAAETVVFEQLCACSSLSALFKSA